MRPSTGRGWAALTLAAAACVAATAFAFGSQQAPRKDAQPETSPGPAIVTPGGSASKQTVTLVAAGDIGSSPTDSKATADLVQALHPDAVLPLGDNAYDEGSERNYARKYDPTWGRFKDISEPVPGNHEYRTSGAEGYFTYFQAQPSTQSYYAWNAGAWRLYALNCEIDCRKGSAEETWLRKGLAAHPNTPALAYVHRPRFTCSTKHEPYTDLTAIWDDLVAADGRLMLAGHNHSYERFALLDGEGRPNADGLRQFVVGTGGAELYPLKPDCPNRQAQDDTTKGVLKLTLSPTSYQWQFVSVTGKVLDEGSETVS
ncbi:MAG: metallophosphoesterase family protein [Actinomycetes bacterium]